MKLIVQTKFELYDNEIESSDHKNKNHWEATFFCWYWSFGPCSQSRNRSDFPFWNKIPKLKFAKNECIILQKRDILYSRHFGTKTNWHEDLSENGKEQRNISVSRQNGTSQSQYATLFIFHVYLSDLINYCLS